MPKPKSEAKPRPHTTIEQVAGSLRYFGKPKTLEEMEAAITEEVKRRYARGRY